MVFCSSISLFWLALQIIPSTERSSSPIAPLGPTVTEGDFKTVKQAVIKLEKQSWQAWKERDAKFFEEFLSDDHVEVGFSGVATKFQLVAFVGSPHGEVKNYSVETFQLTMFGADMALLTYHAVQDTTCGGVAVPSPVWTTSLYVKRGDRWLNAFYQQTQASK